MRWTLLIAAAPSICVSVLAQAPPVPGPNSAVILRSTSTMVTVPALARTPTGEFVNHLHASDFELYDNGVQQSVKLENTDRDPIALLVLLQTGASASGHFADYTDLPTLLDWLLGANDHEIMLVTFDSRVQSVWHFPVRSDGITHSVTHAHAGDQGAAMTDAVNFGVGQLQSEPGHFRRIVLLLGQEQDQGSTAAPEEVLRTLGGAGTAVYSLTFSGPKKSGKPTKSRVHGKSASPNPLRSALDELQQHTAAELAAYTGGGHATFTDRRDFDEAFKAFAADIRNRYMLEFQPAEHESGFHQLAIKVRKGLSATARGGYWFDPPRGDP